MKENQNKKLKRKSQNSHCSLRAILSLLFLFDLELVVKQEKSIESVCCVLAY